MSNEAMDKKINELFEVVRKQKLEVEVAEKESKQSWKTNCSVVVPFSVDANPLNIQTASIEKVKNFVIRLLQYKDYAFEAEEVLGLESNQKYEAFTYDDWLTDAKKRISVIGLREKKDKLGELEKRLNGIVSPEQKRQMELDAITKSLGA